LSKKGKNSRMSILKNQNINTVIRITFNNAPMVIVFFRCKFMEKNENNLYDYC